MGIGVEESDVRVVKRESKGANLANKQFNVQDVVLAETQADPFVFRLRWVLYSANVFVAANVLRMSLRFVQHEAHSSIVV
jgi:hypothetical protein